MAYSTISSSAERDTTAKRMSPKVRKPKRPRIKPKTKMIWSNSDIPQSYTK